MTHCYAHAASALQHETNLTYPDGPLLLWAFKPYLGINQHSTVQAFTQDTSLQRPLEMGMFMGAFMRARPRKSRPPTHKRARGCSHKCNGVFTFFITTFESNSARANFKVEPAPPWLGI
eukprot:6184966-Pleurochrysis_carterae.AAC.3